MTRSGIVRISGAVLVALSATAMFAVSTASATSGGKGHDKPAPSSGDDRAVPHSGNVVKCDQLGLGSLQTISGDTLENQGHAFVDNGGVNITVVSAPAGKNYQVIVVKGGNGYNVYEPGKRGLSVNPPYSNLHSPINGSGHPAGISHWFACVGKGDGGPTETTAPPTETTAPPTETTAPPTETTAPPTETTAPPTETTAPPTETTAPPTETTAPPTETTAPPTDEPTGTPTGGPSETPSQGPTDTPTEAPTSVAPVSNDNGGKGGGKLANTGFNTGFSLTLAGILLAIGLMMVLAPGRLAVAVGRLRRRG